MRTNPAFVQFLIASLLIAAVFFQLSSTYSLFVSRLGYSSAVYGALISFNGVVIVCLELAVSNITRRFNPRSSIAVGYLLVGIGFGLNTFATGLPSLVVAMLILTFGEMISLPVAAAYIADLAPDSMRGRYLGANGLTWGLGLVVGPGLGMFLFSHSAEALWIFCAVAGSISAALIASQRLRPEISNG